jgi:hypothetical protein
LSLLVHGAVIAALVWRANVLLDRAGDGSGPRGGGGERIEFFTLPPAPAMTAVDIPTPQLDLSEIPPLDPIQLDLPRLDVPLTVTSGAVQRPAAGGPGGGTGSGAGPGTGTATGPGTGGEDGYIFPPDPRGAILPPLEGVPQAVRKRPHRVTWWVGADGRIERVEVDPPIADEKYRREFLARMRSYKFEPARTRDGRRVPGVVTITVTP